MDRVVWDWRPRLRQPVAVVAFEGWGDAGAASSGSVSFIQEVLDATRFAVIDGDDFFDFQVQRPLIELDEEGVRELVWPDISFWAASGSAHERDMVIVAGTEPHTRWKALTRDVVSTLDAVGVGAVVTLGAFVGQVPHTLPVPLVGSATDPEVVERHHLFPSGYEGPTGIIGVLNQGLQAAGIEVISVWAAVPHYLSNQDYPPATLALTEAVSSILDLSLDVGDLAAAATEYRRQVDDALDDAELRAYVEELEADSVNDPGERLVEEIERFLREG